ncbi:MAG TPA: AbrB/MazE/SpoVT family DNA-binding domain-containing protein [Longimicrobium sp.]|nr:AbrB/MazE/SpoVT family DNA-binding domain-containing protein [Longimicrobium sp.]
MKISAEGRVTVPEWIRERLDLRPGTRVEWEMRDGVAILRRMRGNQPFTDGAALVAHMRGRGTVRMSTDEIMALTRD